MVGVGDAKHPGRVPKAGEVTDWQKLLLLISCDSQDDTPPLGRILNVIFSQIGGGGVLLEESA